MTLIHIKTTEDVDDKIIQELMNILIRHGFKAEKYRSITGKIVMGKKELKNEK